MAAWDNAVSIDFGNLFPKLRALTVHKYVRSLGVVVSDVEALVAVPEDKNQIAIIVFKSGDKHKSFLEEYEGKRDVVLEERKLSIVISDKSVVEKYVKVGNLPPNLSLEVVKHRLSVFGKIKSSKDMRWETYLNNVEPDYFPVKTGWLIVKMSVDTNIPSYINVGPYRAIVRYPGQIRTCRHCDSQDHLWEGCPQNRKNQQPLPEQSNKEQSDPTPPPSEPQAQKEREEEPPPSPVIYYQTVRSQKPQEMAVDEPEAENIDESAMDSSEIDSSVIPAGQMDMSIADEDSEPSQASSLGVPIPPLTPASVPLPGTGAGGEEGEKTPTTQKRDAPNDVRPKQPQVPISRVPVAETNKNKRPKLNEKPTK